MILAVPGASEFGSQMLLRTFYKNDFEPLKLRGRSPRTKQLYGITFNNFEQFLCRAAALTDLTDETVSRYLSWFRGKGGGRSPCTVNKERNNLLAIWRFGCRRRGPDGELLIREWPNVEPDVEPVDDPVAWLQDDLAKLFQALAALTGMVANIAASAWWLALHSVIWDTGERITAVMKLKWADVDLVDGWVQFRAATRKSGKKAMTHQLHQDTVELLKRLGGHNPEDLVFPWPYNQNYIWRRYGDILTKAGLPADRKSKFHRMRRSVASWVEAAGVSATELLGHSRRKVTEKYIDKRIVRAKQASEILFRPGKNEGELLDRSGM